VSRCIYCDFYLELAKYGGMEAFQQALLREASLRLDPQHPHAQPISTLYVGGGTPSLLPASFYAQLLTLIGQRFGWATSPEITLELNPLDVASPPHAYVEAGFNRFSVGVQSTHPTELKRLSRRHTAEQAKALVCALAEAGAASLSVDLMYGIPQQTPESWQASLAEVLCWHVSHVSLYGLKVEEATPLATLAPLGGQYTLPTDDDTVTLYEMAVEACQQSGLDRYEISNFAKAGHASQHNLAMWQNKPYWALGPAAHGYLPPWRYENQPNLAHYLTAPLLATWQPETQQQRCENALIFGLRTAQGVHLPTLQAEASARWWEALQQALPAMTSGEPPLLTLTHDCLTLNPSLLSMSNEVMTRLLLAIEQRLF
jgi:oxygen-independent coproporphyrinogen-3 oxidase